MLTVVKDIEHLCGTIFRNAGKHLPIAASGNADDGGEMSAIVFDEFDPLFLFLPQLDVTVN